MKSRETDNVVHLPSPKPSKQKLFDMVGELIEKHATDVEMLSPPQEIVGDDNIQLSFDPVTSQSIQGNGNIQIAGSAHALEQRLSSLERFFKTPGRS